MIPARGDLGLARLTRFPIDRAIDDHPVTDAAEAIIAAFAVGVAASAGAARAAGGGAIS